MARTRRVKVDGRWWLWRLRAGHLEWRPAGRVARPWRRRPLSAGRPELVASGRLANLIRGRGLVPETADQVLRGLTGG